MKKQKEQSANQIKRRPREHVILKANWGGGRRSHVREEIVNKSQIAEGDCLWTRVRGGLPQEPSPTAVWFREQGLRREPWRGAVNLTRGEWGGDGWVGVSLRMRLVRSKRLAKTTCSRAFL